MKDIVNKLNERFIGKEPEEVIPPLLPILLYHIYHYETNVYFNCICWYSYDAQ